jgi:hypothetical protein
MPNKYQIGDVVSGSNLADNFKGQTLTAVGFARGSDVPLCILRSHESASPTHIADIEGEAIDFLVISHSDTISMPEARAKFGALWSKRHVRREAQAETGYQARSTKAA